MRTLKVNGELDAHGPNRIANVHMHVHAIVTQLVVCCN